MTDVVTVERASVLVHERAVSPVVIAPRRESVVQVREQHAPVIVREAGARVLFVGGNQGPPGPPGAGSTNDLEVPFAWGDATPKLLGHVDGVVIASSLVLVAAFDGAGAALTIGTLADPDLLLRADQNLPAEPGRYESNPSLEVDADVYLFITPGLGSSQGSGVAFLEITS